MEKKLIPIILVMFLAIAELTCDKPVNEIPASLEVNPPTKNVDETANNFTIDITSTVSWTANSDNNWAIISPTNGEGSGKIKVDYTANTTTSERIATITVKGIGVSDKKISITQKGATHGVTITTPINSTNWQMSTTQTIQWTKNFTDNVKIELYKNTTSIQILDNSNSTNSFSWNIPLTLSAGSDYKIRLTSVTSSNVTTESGFFTISNFVGTVTDIDGNIYNTMQIGTQIWMKENLRVTKDNTSKSISYKQPNGNADVQKYGRLYTYEVANTVCPTGWILPSQDDWNTLYGTTTGEAQIGNKMRSIGWLSTGNTADYAGLYTNAGTYSGFGDFAYFISSTTMNNGQVNNWGVQFYRLDDRAISGYGALSNITAFSVRCLKK